MAGLEAVGIAGPDDLREALTNCTDPLTAIEEFQVQNGIQLPSLQPALPFLDLHGVLRLEFHQSVMEELREKLMQRIKDLSVAARTDKSKHKMLNELLSKCFPVIKVKSLRPVVMCLLKHVPDIGEEYRRFIIENKDMYEEVAVEVKQQIWQDNQALFGDEVSPLLGRYIDMKEAALYSRDTLGPNAVSVSCSHFFQAQPKTRRQEEVVQDLVRLIGHNVRLYDMVLQFLRTLFLRSNNVHYCSLRAELLMALHDIDAQDIVSMDPCHRFAWCLDACLRERVVDLKRARELHAFLDAMKHEQEQVIGDLSMILCDAQAIYTISTTAITALQTCITTETLPRASEELQLLLRMLSLGLKAWNMIDSQSFKESRLDTNLFTKVIPCIVNLMVGDQLASCSSKTVELEPIPTYLVVMCHEDCIACTLLVHYTLHVARSAAESTANGSTVAAAVSSLLRVLAVLSRCNADVVYNDITLHDLTHSLATLTDQFSNTEFCQVVFDKFFLPQISKENVVHHVLRLLWWTYTKIHLPTLDRLMKLIKTSTVKFQVNEAVVKLYEELVERIMKSPPSLETSQETQHKPHRNSIST